MKKKTALISWIGDADLVEFYHDDLLPSNLKEQFINNLPKDKNRDNLKNKLNMPDFDFKSSIRIILSNKGKEINEIHLMTNRLSCFLKNNKRFEKFICPNFKGKITIHDCEEKVPRITELSNVYTASQEIISFIRNSCSKIYCNITAGVGATASALIMLCSAYFEESHILQTHKEKVFEDTFPEKFSSLILRRAIKTEEELQGTKIIGKSAIIKQIRNIAARIAPFDYSVLLLGPSGTGKSTLAREIHQLSSRHNEKFEYINCGSLTPALLESRLYGHKKGAFTDAKEDSNGLFKTANKGTIFLDEIADCTLEMQASLLHVLQPEDNTKPTERKFRPIGAEKDETSDVRIIAATNKNIKQLIRENKFREDLYYRLATTTIYIPGLSERIEDIPDLAHACLDQINLQNKTVPGYAPKKLSDCAIESLKNHNWTGNVRELQNIIQQAAIMTDDETITATNIKFYKESNEQNTPEPESFSIENIKADLERRYIALAIETTGGNKAHASRLLGMKTPQNLESRMKALKMNICRG